MTDAERKKKIAEMFAQSAQVAAEARRMRGVTNSFEYTLIMTYEALRRIEKDFDEGSFIIEGVGGKAFYDKLMELFGVIEGRRTELGLK